MENTALRYFILFIIPFVGTLIITPIISRFAYKTNIVDRPGLHKTHIKSTPLLGGLSIFLCFAAVLFIFIPIDEKLLTLVVATLVLVVTGLLDDIYNLKPWLKITGQTVASIVVVVGNAHLFRFMVLYFKRFLIPEAVVLFLIIGWVVLMVNAFNLIDGLDGLAAGTAAIIFLAMALLSYIEGGRANVLGVQLIGAGACLGFLVFNFNPAKIFMGDTGSMLLGFILASSHLFAIKYPFSVQLVLGSMFIFAYPALDVTYAFYRRISSKTPLFEADQGHIHHVLLRMGFSVRKTVAIIYLINITFSGLAIFLLSINISPPYFLCLGILTALSAAILFRKLYLFGNSGGENKAG